MADAFQIQTEFENISSISEQENKIEVDYGLLEQDKKDEKEYELTIYHLNKDLQVKKETIEKFATSKIKATEKLDIISGKVVSMNEEFQNAKKKLKIAKTAFENIKNERVEKFNHCLTHISDKIDGIYKGLTQNEGAQAYLCSENVEEPYLDGINYDCVAPGKRFRRMAHMSGGEKAIAALALLFAIHSYQPTPFFVLDEIDATLDNTNIGKIVSFIQNEKNNLQTIAISLKEQFYGHTDTLVGITPEKGDCLISKIFMFDLTSFNN